MDMSAAMIVVMAVMMGAMLIGMVGVGWSWIRRRLTRHDEDVR